MIPKAPFSLGFSPCPNDTFIFCRLVEEAQNEPQPYFQQPHLEDVETLNRWAFEGRLEITKLSFHAIAHLLDSYCILNSGSALGRGCGPLLIGRETIPFAELTHKKVAIPGTYTTAALLFRMFAPESTNLVEMRFEQIIDAVASGTVDAGVIIHESRFTYATAGLVCLQDLGQWWEDSFDAPLPLGCIGVKRALQPSQRKEIDRRIGASLRWARAHPERCYDFIKKYAQETEDSVIDQHIGLYVNEFSLDLGDEGRRAVELFIQEGRRRKVLPPGPESVFCSG